MGIVDVLQAAAPMAWFIGGYAARAGLEHREARLQAAILIALEMGPLRGLEMVRMGLGKRGTIYVRLNRMEEYGLIESQLEAEPSVSGGLRRRVYGITDVGMAALKVEKARR